MSFNFNILWFKAFRSCIQKQLTLLLLTDIRRSQTFQLRLHLAPERALFSQSSFLITCSLWSLMPITQNGWASLLASLHKPSLVSASCYNVGESCHLMFVPIFTHVINACTKSLIFSPYYLPQANIVQLTDIELQKSNFLTEVQSSSPSSFSFLHASQNKI